MARVYYYLSAQVVNNRAEVRVRFTATGVNRRAATGILAPVELWNADEGRLSISKRYETPLTAEARKTQAKLDELADRILSAYYTNKTACNDAKWLENIIAPPTDENAPTWQEIEPYCDAKNVAPATRRKLRAMGTHLRAYGKKYTELYTRTLTARELERFFGFLIREEGMSQNAAACRLRQLRTVVYWHKPFPNPFDDFVIPASVYGDPIYLTKDERDFVGEYNGLTTAQERQRDIFIFQCHTGCRVQDLLSLTYANIRDGWLVYVPKKTTRYEPRTVEVPLTAKAQAIIERYKGVDVRGRLLPFLSPQKYNEAIQRVLRACAIVRPVMVFNPKTFETRPVPLCEVATSHTARKTFIQIAYAATGDKRLVASMSGHSENSQAFNRYSEISRDMKQTALNAMQSSWREFGENDDTKVP